MKNAEFQSIFEANKDAVYGFAWPMTGWADDGPGHYSGLLSSVAESCPDGMTARDPPLAAARIYFHRRFPRTAVTVSATMMDAETLIAELNGYPLFSNRLSGEERQRAEETISGLLEIFEKADQQQRCHITRSLDSTALGVLYGFSQDKAIEGRRNCSTEMIRAGLLAAVMGGGSPRGATAGSLASILLRMP